MSTIHAASNKRLLANERRHDFNIMANEVTDLIPEVLRIPVNRLVYGSCWENQSVLLLSFA